MVRIIALTSSAIWIVTLLGYGECNKFSRNTRPLNIAHRGASGTVPEHTSEAYRTAIAMGADYVECDVHLTKDLQPVCLHDPWLSEITDVQNHPEFTDRYTTYYIEYYGNITDWFAIDFTLTELKTMKIYQRYSFRDSSLDNQYVVTTLQEFINVVREETSRTVGIYPEVKNPAWQNSLALLNGSRIEDIFLDIIHGAGYTEFTDACFLQSFDEDTARYLASMTSLPVIMLVRDDSWEGKMAEWSQYFVGVGVSKTLIAIYYDEDNGYKNWITDTSSLVQDAHAEGLQVHAFTFRNEDRYLAWDFKQDILEEYRFFQEHGLDGFFTDFPETLANYLEMEDPEGETCPNKARDVGGLPTAAVLILAINIWLL